VCGACVGKVTAGATDMSDIDDLEFTVTEEEQADGMALLCMARPVVSASLAIRRRVRQPNPLPLTSPVARDHVPA
jgi:ferredoxin